MTPALETYLADLEAAEEKMTPRPWNAEGDEVTHGEDYLICDCLASIGGTEDAANALGIALLRNRAKALCGMVRILHDALVTTKSGMGGVDTDIANNALAAVALIAKGQGEGV